MLDQFQREAARGAEGHAFRADADVVDRIDTATALLLAAGFHARCTGVDRERLAVVGRDAGAANGWLNRLMVNLTAVRPDDRRGRVAAIEDALRTWTRKRSTAAGEVATSVMDARARRIAGGRG